jgi:hypothetical protein
VQSTVAKLLGSVSGADTITAVGSPTVAAYAAGQMFYFVAAGANTGAVTINIDSLGAKNITRDGTTALAAGDIQSGEVCVIVYDGTQFQLVNGASQSAAIVTNSLTVNGTSSLDGAVTINDSGADVDFRIESDTDANAFFLDGATGNVGLKTDTPATLLSLENSLLLESTATDFPSATYDGAAFVAKTGSGGSAPFDQAGSLVYRTRVSSTAGRSSHIFYTGSPSVERLRINESGNLGLGVTPSAWVSTVKSLDVNTGASFVGTAAAASMWSNAFVDSGSAFKYKTSAEAAYYSQGSGAHSWYTAPSGTAGNTITFTQAMTLDASGNLGVGTTSPAHRLQVETASATGDIVGYFRQGSGAVALISSATDLVGFGNGATAGETRIYADGGSGFVTFRTNSIERARIDASGNFVFNENGNDCDFRVESDGNENAIFVDASSNEVFFFKNSGSATVAGAFVQSNGRILATTNSNLEPLLLNRQDSDGVLVEFRQANTVEGTISVSGATVSYNAFAGSHWSQLQDGSKPDILRGTVMESINELCVWPGEDNERLPKCKISDTAGSKKVYGVFMAWDNDWAETNDMYVTAVGAFICRVNAGVTVQEGDLLESNGDGTARVQADDIIRSSTIGKVTSTVKTHEYDDGSYCVPTVLYCG